MDFDLLAGEKGVSIFDVLQAYLGGWRTLAFLLEVVGYPYFTFIQGHCDPQGFGLADDIVLNGVLKEHLHRQGDDHFIVHLDGDLDIDYEVLAEAFFQ